MDTPDKQQDPLKGIKDAFTHPFLFPFVVILAVCVIARAGYSFGVWLAH